jgi:hypothetical protein
MPNAAATFKAARAENFLAVAMNTNDYAETVSYQRAAGGAAVSFAVLARLAIADRREEQTEKDVSILVVKIARDPAGLAGLAMPPVRGDWLHRDLFGDPPNVAYAFTGRIISSTDHWWKCEFERFELAQVGITR